MKYGMLVDLDLCVGCGACVMACKLENGTALDIHWCHVLFKEVGKYPNAKMKVMSLSCMHCENAPCVNVCPTGATYYDGEGNVLVDLNKCIGCRSCLAACPYNIPDICSVAQKDNPYWEGHEMTPLEKIICQDHVVGTKEKCDRCQDRLAEGRNVACAEACPTKSRVFGDLDDPNSDVAKQILEKNAQPLLGHLKTKPTVYYVGKF
ncbi:MAG TPA: 4Fe-4S dicluster domain-containing protein [Syntrophomonadaceae bacterium]|nr:4Fe-4S dicluster domain-containing protein [Syntrophomonadaceae bacterium]